MEYLNTRNMTLVGTFKNLFSLKYGALSILVLQNTFLVLSMRYSRTLPGDMYASSTAVVMMEGLKLLSCLAIITYQNNGPIAAAQTIHREIICQPMELLKLSVPSVLYTIQNNLLYFALSHLDAATYQVGYQFKILTTAGAHSDCNSFCFVMLFKSSPAHLSV